MTKPNGVELPVGWVLSTLGECFRWGSGGTPLRSRSEYYGGEIPWAVIGDLTDGPVTATASFITPLGLRNSATKVVPAGSVLLAMYGSIGKLGINTIPLATNQAIAFTYSDPVDPKYLFYYLLFARGRLAAKGKGGTQSNISQTVIKQFPFVVAPLPAQHRIVGAIESYFTRLEDAMRTLEHTQRNLRRYRASVLKAAIEGRLVPTEAELACAKGRDYEPASVLLERILAEQRRRWHDRKRAPRPLRKGTNTQEQQRGGATNEPELSSSAFRLPEGWVAATLGELFHVRVGSTPSRAKPEYWSGGIPWVSSGEVAFCRIRSTRETISQHGLDNSSTRLNPEGSVLLGMIGEGKTRGQAAILDISACNNQNSAAIWVSETEIPPAYVYYFLMQQYEVTRTRGSGNNQPALNKARVQAITIPLPPLKEAIRIVDEVSRQISVIDILEVEVERNLSRCRTLRQSILKWAFEGRLVDQDPTDEPASVLLKRVQAERVASAIKTSNRKPRRKGKPANA